MEKTEDCFVDDCTNGKDSFKTYQVKCVKVSSFVGLRGPERPFGQSDRLEYLDQESFFPNLTLVGIMEDDGGVLNDYSHLHIEPLSTSMIRAYSYSGRVDPGLTRPC